MLGRGAIPEPSRALPGLAREDRRYETPLEVVMGLGDGPPAAGVASGGGRGRCVEWAARRPRLLGSLYIRVRLDKTRCLMLLRAPHVVHQRGSTPVTHSPLGTPRDPQLPSTASLQGRVRLPRPGIPRCTTWTCDWSTCTRCGRRGASRASSARASCRRSRGSSER